MFFKLAFAIFALSLGSTVAQLLKCIQGGNCRLPDCFCPTFNHPQFMDTRDIPQMVYFGFDDALHGQVDRFYKQLFTESRKNPNGCPITMSLYVQDQYTSYSLVNSYYQRGHEIGSHSVTHTNVDTVDKLLFEAGKQKDNLTHVGHVPRDQVVGWRSPNLKPAGDAQPEVLKRLGYTYDISLTYTRHTAQDPIPWPYTLDYGYPYPCSVQPCPGPRSRHPGFWEVPVHSLYDPQSGYPCAYVDSCRPNSKAAAMDYLWSNFEKVYNSNRAPFGLNMHAAWFYTETNLQATHAFLDRLLRLGDVYVVTAKQVLDWMRNPVKVTDVHKLTEWGCKDGGTPVQAQHPRPAQTPSPTRRPAPTTQRAPTPTTTRRPRHVVTWGPPPATRRPFRPHPPSFTLRPRPAVTSRPTPSPTQRPTQRPVNVQIPDLPLPVTRSPLIPSPNRPLSFIPPGTNVGPVVIPYDNHFNVQNNNSSKNNSTIHRVPSVIFNPEVPVTNAPTTAQTAGLTGVQTDKCLQGETCVLPSCQCRSLLPPAGLSRINTPQIVYLTFMGSVNSINFQQILDLLTDSSIRNPNGCPITSTFFVPNNGNYAPYIESLSRRGHEVSLYGSQMFGTSVSTAQQVYGDLNAFRKTAGVSRGYRVRNGVRPGDALMRTLRPNGVLYDSSLVTSKRVASSDVTPWPYTLDYGWQDCNSVRCPTGRHPGLWEVPITPLVDYKQQFVCTYADACHNRPPTSQETYNYLVQNLEHNMNTNRAPLGIHLRKEWFSHAAYAPNVEGISMFLKTVLHTRTDVYVTSVQKMLDWMRAPTGLDRLGSLDKWTC